MKAPTDRMLLAIALTALAACLLFPISNPDIFWHLSAAKRILADHALPRADWLSHTLQGRPWIDFEWLPQLLYWLPYQWGGMAGLLALKVLLLAAAAILLLRTMDLYGLHPAYRAVALAAWSASCITRSDIRPDLFSILGFGSVFLALEARRLGKGSVSAWWAIPFFFLWTNLHAGFAYGLLLLLCYAAGEGRKDHTLWPHLALAWIGTLLAPYGLSTYRILWQHWQDRETLATHIIEWGFLRLDNPLHWPGWILLMAGFASALIFVRRKHWIALGPLAALVYFGISAFLHARFAAYYITLGVPLTLYWARQADLLDESPSPRARWACGALCVLCAVYSVWWGQRCGFMRRAFDDRFIPLRAAAYLEKEHKTLARYALYNPWGWGGYLGWRLYPHYRVFQDGRYIFQPLLAEAGRAVRDADSWKNFLNHYGIDVAVMENIPLRFNMVKRYPDGSAKPFQRPYYALFMPKERWALVHWDEKALVFARRDALPQPWIEANEYRYARPFDDEALREALELREIPVGPWREELRRHAAEAAKLVP